MPNTDFLYLIILIVGFAVAISVIIHMDPRITTAWWFWVAIIMLLLTFLGVPAGIYYMTFR
jgi:hypothetical protein